MSYFPPGSLRSGGKFRFNMNIMCKVLIITSLVVITQCKFKLEYRFTTDILDAFLTTIVYKSVAIKKKDKQLILLLSLL